MIQKFNSLSHKIKLAIAAFFIVFVVALLVLQFSSISALNGEIENEKSILESEQARLNQIKKIAANYDQFEARLAVLEKALPNKISEETIMTSVQSTASISSSDLPSIQVSKPVGKTDYQEVPVTIAVNGTFPKFLALIKNIKSAERAIKINSITLGRDTSKPGGIKATVIASAFIGVAPAPTPASAAPATTSPAK